MVAGGSLVAQQRREIKSRLYEIASKLLYTYVSSHECIMNTIV